jgi:hypothetical protein
MKLSPRREAGSHSATQKIPELLYNRKVSYRVTKSSQLVSILSKFISVHTHPIPMWSILILFFHVSLCLPSAITVRIFILFHYRFWNKSIRQIRRISNLFCYNTLQLLYHYFPLMLDYPKRSMNKIASLPDELIKPPVYFTSILVFIR